MAVTRQLLDQFTHIRRLEHSAGVAHGCDTPMPLQRLADKHTKETTVVCPLHKKLTLKRAERASRVTAGSAAKSVKATQLTER